MYDHILAALDGSPLAERVLPHVETLAGRLGAAVTLLRATAPLERTAAATAIIESGATVDPAELVAEERRAAAAYLEVVAGRLRQRGLAVDWEQPEGDAADALLEQARRSRTDLIAMTTHGRGGLARLVFGSVAEHVLHHAPCPVLLVRVREGEDAGRA